MAFSRKIETKIWRDSWFQKLSKDAKYLFLYLFTNPEVNAAGCYEITLKTISFDTGIEEDKLPQLFIELSERVTYFEQNSIVWVKNFTRYQTLSYKFIIRAIKDISEFPDHIQKEWLLYNLELVRHQLKKISESKENESIKEGYKRDIISIYYRYNIDIISDSVSESVSVSESEKNNIILNDESHPRDIKHIGKIVQEVIGGRDDESRSISKKPCGSSA